MITERIKHHFSTYDIPADRAVVVGSALLDALELRTSHDIDVMVTKETFDRVASLGHKTTPYSDGTRQLIIDDLELMYSWRSRTLEDFLPDSISIDGVQFLSPEGLLAWKREQNRSKDHTDIVLLEAYLKAQSAAQANP